MIDKEKVLHGLSSCGTDHGIPNICEVTECPYREDKAWCVHGLAHDAGMLIAELLKAQEPRVMTLREVLDMKFDDVVYLQVYPTNAVLSAIVIDVIPKLSEINVGVVQFRHGAGYNGINNADLSYYGKTWRCWTSRPTDEQKEAVPWNG